MGSSWILFILVNVILPFAIGVASNFATPWIKSYLNDRSLSYRQRRILILLNEFDYIKHLNSDPHWGIYTILRRLLFPFSLLVILVVYVGQFSVPIAVADEPVFFLSQYLADKMPFLSPDAIDFIIVEGGLIILVATIFGEIYRRVKDLDKVLNFDHYYEEVKAKAKILGISLKDAEQEEEEANNRT